MNLFTLFLRGPLASNSGLEPYAGDGTLAGVAWAGGNAGQPLRSELIPSVCRSCPDREKATSSMPRLGEGSTDTAESENRCMRRPAQRENREIRLVSTLHGDTFTAEGNGQKTFPTVMLT